MNIRTLIPLIVLAILAAGGAYMHRMPLPVDDRLNMPLDAFAPGMTEAQVVAAVRPTRLDCIDQPGFFMGARVCQARLREYFDVPARFVAFFFKDGRLSGAKVDVPNAQHRVLGSALLGRYGSPTMDDKSLPAGGVRLIGWNLPKGKLVYNRDRDIDAKVHNTLLWLSEAQAASMGIGVR